MSVRSGELMNDTPARGRAFGDPVYVAAHGITVNDQVLKFEYAHALATLVLRYEGGPQGIGGKHGIMKRQANLLQRRGYLAICGEVPESYDVTFDSRIVERGGFKLTTYEARVQRALGDRITLCVIATQEGVDLVSRHLQGAAGAAFHEPAELLPETQTQGSVRPD